MHLLRTCLTVVVLLSLAITWPAAPAAAQTPASTARVRVYLDCFDCFPQYLRNEVTFVDFVNQAQDADVHLLSRSQPTGGGGREVVLRFVGRGRFEGHDHDLRAVTIASDTENTRREVIFRTVVVGLLDYVAHDGIPAGVNLTVSTESNGQEAGVTDDPWNYWVFSVRGESWFERDERQTDRTLRLNYSADRITENWKITFGGRINENRQTFVLRQGEPEESELEVTREDRDLTGFVARSLGPHWSVGVRGRVASSTFSNNRFTAGLAPAIEYSVFPYSEYASRQLRFGYQLGVDRVRYNEVTIFDKQEETLAQQELSVRTEQRQTWGSVFGGFEFSQYLHDFARYRIDVQGSASIRLARGLSVNFSGDASRIRDQISLPRRGATSEEVLLSLRQLQSGYDLGFRVGLTYSFGSLFNNIVNPRFGN
jgi:hypothetical protein